VTSGLKTGDRESGFRTYDPVFKPESMTPQFSNQIDASAQEV